MDFASSSCWALKKAMVTLDDVVAFQKAHVANRTYRYMILGNKKELDMKFLKTCGTVKQLKTKDTFVY